jgi:PTS system glucose-specific IIC component
VRPSDPARLDAAALRSAGVPATQPLANGEIDLIVGLDAADLAGAMR